MSESHDSPDNRAAFWRLVSAARVKEYDVKINYMAMEMSDPITPLTPADEVADAQAVEHERYIHKALVALDIFANVLTGGQEDMTISSRASLAAQHGSPIGKALSSFLNLFEKDHGLKAEIGDEVRTKELQSTLEPNIASETK